MPPKPKSKKPKSKTQEGRTGALSPWLKHLAEFRKKNPHLGLIEATKEAAKTYRRA
jgi:hypothetical protein